MAMARVGSSAAAGAVDYRDVDLEDSQDVKQHDGSMAKAKPRDDDAMETTAGVRSPVTSAIALRMSPTSRLTSSFLQSRDRVRARLVEFFGGDERSWRDDEDEEKHDSGNPIEYQQSPTTYDDGDDTDGMMYRASRRDFAALELQVQCTTPRVPRLAMARVVPKTRLPKMAQVWMFLDRIEYIAISEAYVPDDDEGTVYYVLDVFHYQEQHSIPTCHRRPMRTSRPPAHRRPDYQIQHRFSNFTRLRKNILDATRASHARESCAYCQKIATFVTSDTAAPLGWRAKLWTTVEARKASLAPFIMQLVQLARERQDSCRVLATLNILQQPANRHVNRCVPGLVKRFLTGQTGENFMR